MTTTWMAPGERENPHTRSRKVHMGVVEQVYGPSSRRQVDTIIE